MKKLLSKVAKSGLDVLAKNATKKAEKECPGFLYEPKVPKKLKKTLCLALVCIMTAVTVLAGSTSNYYAADYTYDNWNTYYMSPASTTTSDTAYLYFTDEECEWAVTTYSVASGYGYVELTGINNTVTMSSGNARLSQVGQKRFTFKRKSGNTATLASFGIAQDTDSYPSNYSGYIKIL